MSSPSYTRADLEKKRDDEPMKIEDIKPGDTVLLKNGEARFGGVVWRPPSFPDQLIAGDTTIFTKGEWIVREEHIVEIRPGRNRHD